MHVPTRNRTRPVARKPLAATVAAGLLLAAPMTALASTWVVTNCNDSGENSLRDIIDNKAENGDNVDLSFLICSTISLTTGTLVIDQDNLSLRGPETVPLTIEGGAEYPFSHHYGSLLRHTGDGTLSLQHLTLTSPVAQMSSGYGGCVSSRSNLYLKDMVVTSCLVQGSGLRSQGGAIYAEGDLQLVDSTVQDNGIWFDWFQDNWIRGGGIAVEGNLDVSNSVIRDNTIHTDYSTDLYGGGIWVAGNATLQDSQVSGNTADSTSTVHGGGLFVGGDLTLVDSIVSGNTSRSDRQTSGGGICVVGTLTMTDTSVTGNTASINPDAPYSLPTDHAGGGGIWSTGPFTVLRSTIAGNTAEVTAGAMFMDSTSGHQREIANSTISGNQSSTAPAGIYAVSAPTIHNTTIAFNMASEPSTTGGAGIRSLLGLEMQSSIIAGNTSGGDADDVVATVTGSHNLIFAPGASTIPADTIVGVDPMLGDLSVNGGPTRTIPLLEGSPAIDHGSNPDGLMWDQRGSGFTRLSGTAADIGAFEFDPDALPDVIFSNGFD